MTVQCVWCPHNIMSNRNSEMVQAFYALTNCIICLLLPHQVGNNLHHMPDCRYSSVCPKVCTCPRGGDSLRKLHPHREDVATNWPRVWCQPIDSFLTINLNPGKNPCKQQHNCNYTSDVTQPSLVLFHCPFLNSHSPDIPRLYSFLVPPFFHSIFFVSLSSHRWWEATHSTSLPSWVSDTALWEWTYW